MKAMKTLAIIAIVVGLLSGGAYMWGASQVISDTTHPEIKDASTHGAVPYNGGYPNLLLFVDENLGIELAEAEIRTKGGILNYGSKLVESISLDYVSKNGDIYQFRGSPSVQLEQNTEYRLIYRVYDLADLGDTWTTSLETVNLAGKVTVNGFEVKGPTDKIYVNSHDLGIQVEITQAADSVHSIYGTVNGERLDFEKSPSGIWICGYTLPGDGVYEFYIQVLDTAGVDTRLASFGITLGKRYTTEILVMSLVGMGVLALWYRKPGPVSQKTKGGR